MLKIKLVKGFIHKKDFQIATAISLGLRKIGAETLQPDNAATRGKIAKSRTPAANSGEAAE